MRGGLRGDPDLAGGTLPRGDAEGRADLHAEPAGRRAVLLVWDGETLRTVDVFISTSAPAPLFTHALPAPLRNTFQPTNRSPVGLSPGP